MFILKLPNATNISKNDDNLHSTMFILKLEAVAMAVLGELDLHSTMFILKPHIYTEC